MKKVSIITITYNLIENDRDDLFEEMFLSLHNQTYENIEHVIIDGNSTDGTQDFVNEIIKKYSKKEVTFISEPDNGINDATNKGFRVAKGDYLTIMCSDDYYTRDDAIELLVNALEKKNADFACGNCWWLEKKVWKAKPESFVYKHPFTFNALVFKKEIFNNIGGLDEEFKVASDYDFFFRLLINYKKYAVVNKTVSALRPGGVSNNNTRKQSREIVKTYYKIYNKYYPECKFTKKEMDCLTSSYAYKYSVGLVQILKILFRMKNTRMKWLMLKHYNIFYYIESKIHYVVYKLYYHTIMKIYCIFRLFYIISKTEIL